MKFFSIAFILSATLPLTGAIVASPNSWTAHQADRSSVGGKQRLVGTPSYSYSIVETNGAGFYTTIMDTDGYVKYAVIDDITGELVPSRHVVGFSDPEAEGIELGQIESPKVIEAKCDKSDYCSWHRDNNGKSHTTPPGEEYKILVVPFKFVLHADRDMHLDVLEERLFNHDTYSVKDYFYKQSYGKLSVVTDFAQEVTIPKTEAECANSVSGLSNKMHECLKLALTKSLDGKDTTGYDTVAFVHSGYGAEYGGQDEHGTYYTDRIWSHAWEIDAPEYSGRYALFSAFYSIDNGHVNRVGVAVHEIAQAMGAPTLYGLPGNGGYGLGYYDVMSNPWGFDGTLESCGSMSAYTKHLFEWVTVEDITKDGTMTLGSSDMSNKVYKISQGFPRAEYLLIENREITMYDIGMHQPGVAILHVDMAASDLAGHKDDGMYPVNHYRVALIQADGRFDLERGENAGDMGDLFNGFRFAGVDSKGVMDLHGDRMIDEKGVTNGYRGVIRTHPTTQSYQEGKLRDTGLAISGVSVASEKMQFTVTFSATSSS